MKADIVGHRRVRHHVQSTPDLLFHSSCCPCFDGLDEQRTNCMGWVVNNADDDDRILVNQMTRRRLAIKCKMYISGNSVFTLYFVHPIHPRAW